MCVCVAGGTGASGCQRCPEEEVLGKNDRRTPSSSELSVRTSLDGRLEASHALFVVYVGGNVSLLSLH